MSDKKIVGGEFVIPLELATGELLSGAEEDSGRNYYASGRTCLYAILKSIATLKGKNGGVLIPDYICASVTKAVKDVGYDISFYKIGNDFLPDMESLCMGLLKEKIVLLVNYFGMIDFENIVSAIRQQSEDAVVIVDEVQNYYGLGKMSDFDYAFTSFRKWFPVADGAEVVSKKAWRGAKLPKFKLTNKFAQYKFAGNILKNFEEEIDNSIYLTMLEDGERVLDKSYQCKYTARSLATLKRIDRRECAEKRKNNAKILHEGLNELGILHPYKDDAVPLFVPIILENRTEMRKKFFECNIFCPIHWPYESEKLQGRNSLYDMELSLICDQRYDEGDMRLMLEILEREYTNM